jgi:hypothetical protein
MVHVKARYPDTMVSHLLVSRNLHLDNRNISLISDHVDHFVNQCGGSETVEDVLFYPYSLVGKDNEFWDKVGQAIGNLQSLEGLQIRFSRSENEDVPSGIPDWEIMASILRHVRQKVRVYFEDDEYMWTTEEVEALTRAIRGHPTITSFEDYDSFPNVSLDTLYSALVTLPALESISLHYSELPEDAQQPEDECTLANHENLAELLRLPSLRSICFDRFYFTPTLCQAIANAFMEGTAITNLEFSLCSSSAEECVAIIANGLSRKTSVTSIIADCRFHVELFDALVAILPSNSTLRDLSFFCSENDVSPALLALGKNTGLKEFSLDGFGLINETLCTAMQNGLGTNATLEHLEFKKVGLCNDSKLWCRAFSFLRTNKAIKSLVVHVSNTAMAADVSHITSCVSAIHADIAAMLQENSSLQSLTFSCEDKIHSSQGLFEVVTALQHNTTLKSLSLFPNETFQLTYDESKQLASLLKKNYSLESLPDDFLKNIFARVLVGDVGAILRLNAAGRRYLIEDGSSISKGVEVLSRVNDDINCVFLHLLENPRLCDRSAVEMVVNVGVSNSSRSANPTDTSGGGKREQASEHQSRESRRRLA